MRGLSELFAAKSPLVHHHHHPLARVTSLTASGSNTCTKHTCNTHTRSLGCRCAIAFGPTHTHLLCALVQDNHEVWGSNWRQQLVRFCYRAVVVVVFGVWSKNKNATNAAAVALLSMYRMQACDALFLRAASIISVQHDDVVIEPERDKEMTMTKRNRANRQQQQQQQ